MAAVDVISHFSQQILMMMLGCAFIINGWIQWCENVPLRLWEAWIWSKTNEMLLQNFLSLNLLILYGHKFVWCHLHKIIYNNNNSCCCVLWHNFRIERERERGAFGLYKTRRGRRRRRKHEIYLKEMAFAWKRYFAIILMKTTKRKRAGTQIVDDHCGYVCLLVRRKGNLYLLCVHSSFASSSPML